MNLLQQGGPYKFTRDENHEDLSSGRVIYGATGATNFPVRLISEIFLRADNVLASKEPYTIFDPFCGSGYSLTVLGFMHPERIKHLIGSDVSEDMLGVAAKNLSLLTKPGLEKRIVELRDLGQKFGKISHQEALESAERLLKKLKPEGIESTCFKYNVLEGQPIPVDLKSVELVIADLPYGKLTSWDGSDSKTNPVQGFLSNIKTNLGPHTLIALSFNKKQEIEHKGFKRIQSIKVGARKVLFLQID